MEIPPRDQQTPEALDGGEAFVGLLVARGNTSKGFYSAEEVFDEMPPLAYSFAPLPRGEPCGHLYEESYTPQS